LLPASSWALLWLILNPEAGGKMFLLKVGWPSTV
jgi:hypothetical protein